jgi:hypothetical protein
MRILTKEEAKRIDPYFIYNRGDAIAIIRADFKAKFNIVPKEAKKKCNV